MEESNIVAEGELPTHVRMTPASAPSLDGSLALATPRKLYAGTLRARSGFNRLQGSTPI